MCLRTRFIWVFKLQVIVHKLFDGVHQFQVVIPKIQAGGFILLPEL